MNSVTFDFLYSLILKDIKLKYKGSIFGFAWSLFNPLLMIIVYTWVFDFLLKTNIQNFSMYLLAGILPWNFFSSTISSMVNAFTNNADLLRKAKFPRYILILSSIGFNLFVFLMTLVIVIVGMIYFHILPDYRIVNLPFALLLEVLFLFGLGLILGTLNVVFHDTRHLVEVILMFWFWITPIVYAWNLIPSSYLYLMSYNPMSAIINLYQSSILKEEVHVNLWISISVILVVFFCGCLIYKKYNRNLAEWV